MASDITDRESQMTGWLGLAEAARRSGLSEDHLRRLCRDKWHAAGQARQIEGGGRRRRWQVRETADAALARAKFPEQMGGDLTKVPEAKRREALRRRQVLLDWAAAKRGAFAMGFDADQATAQYLAHVEAEAGKAISRSTLYLWERRYRAGGVVGLVDGRGGGGQECPHQQDAFLLEVRRLYLTPRKLKLSVCVEIASLKAGENGWQAKSYKTCQRYIATLPRALVLKQRFGEEAFVNEAEPYVERDYSGLASNEIWCADHHLFDVIIQNQGRLLRPWLTAWQDLRSRRIVGFQVFAHDPSSDPILAAFREAVLAEGVPEKVYVDNGKDFDSFALNGRTKRDRWLRRTVRFELDEGRAGVFPGLGIETIHAWPYHGQSKPIERWFGTIEQWTPAWATYCGRSTEQKPEDLQLQIERGKAPPLEEFREWFGGIVAAYNARPHSGDSMDDQSPDAVFAACLHAKRTTTREVLDVHCLRVTRPVKVGQNGVMYQGLRYGQHQLIDHLGREVILRVDDARLASVQVWSLDGRFLALAHANQKLPFDASSEQLREAIRQKKQARRNLAAHHQTRMRLVEDLPDLMVRASVAAGAARASGPRPAGPEASIRPIRTALGDQMPALRAALESEKNGLRTAVGAEGMSLADLDSAIAHASPITDDDDFAALGRALSGGGSHE